MVISTTPGLKLHPLCAKSSDALGTHLFAPLEHLLLTDKLPQSREREGERRESNSVGVDADSEKGLGRKFVEVDGLEAPAYTGESKNGGRS